MTIDGAPQEHNSVPDARPDSLFEDDAESHTEPDRYTPVVAADPSDGRPDASDDALSEVDDASLVAPSEAVASVRPDATDQPHEVAHMGGQIMRGGGLGTREVRIRAIREGGEDDPTEYDKPSVGMVLAALRRGATLRYVLSRKEENGPISLVISPELRPPQAETEPADQEGGPQHPDAPGDNYWVRFGRHEIPTDDLSEERTQPQREVPQSPLDVTDLLEGYDGTFQLVIQAEGIPPGSEGFQQIYRRLRDGAHNAGVYNGDELDLNVSHAKLAKIAAAVGTAAARVSVMVQAPAEHLHEVVPLVEGALPVNENSVWSAERVGDDLVGYRTREAALAADRRAELEALEAATTLRPIDGNSDTGAKTLSPYVEGRDFRDSITFPAFETAGMQRTRRQILPVEQVLPPGTRAVRIGRRLDNLFDKGGMRKIAGELLLPIKDLVKHVLIFGGSGGGKSEFARQLVGNAKLDNYLRRRAGEDIPPLKVFAIDFKKGGASSNWGKVFADRLAQLGLPPEEATVNTIRPGQGGLRPILDLCDPRHSTPARQAERILHSVMLGVSSGTGLGMSGADGETQRVVERYVKGGIIAAYVKLGWDMEADVQSQHGLPHPTMAMIAHEIRASFEGMDYKDDVKGNLSEFNAGQFDNNLKLLPGRFFKYGHPIDFDATMDDPGVTTFELDELGNNDTARKVAAVGIIQEIEKIVDARHKALGIVGGVGEPEVLIALDEAGMIFDMTPAGYTTSEFLTRLRDKGIAFVIAQQVIKDMNDMAFRNITGGVFGMRSTETKVVAEHNLMGEATEEQLGFMISREVLTHPGTGLAFVAGTNGVVGFRSVHLSELPPGEGAALDARHLIRVGTFERPYSGETIARANRFLNERRAGHLVTAWAEANVALVLMGREPPKLDGAFREAMIKMPDKQLRDAAIIEAVNSAVDARSQYTRYTRDGPDAIKKYLAGSMIDQASNRKVPEVTVKFGMCLAHGYYSRVRDIVENSLTAPRLENTKVFETFFSVTANKMLGSNKFQEITVGGLTAEEQKHNLERFELESIGVLRNVITAGSRRDMTSTETLRARLALVRLIGSADNVKGAAHVRAQLKLPHDQVGVFEELVKGLPPPPPPETDASELCILRMKELVDKTIADRWDTAPADPLEKWKRVYKGQRFDVESNLAKDQLALIEKLEKDLLAGCEYDNEEFALVDLLFASDLRNGGLALDNAIAGLASFRGLQGQLYRKAEHVISDGKPPKLTIAERAKALEVDDWSGVIGDEVIYGKEPNLRFTQGAKRWLVRQVNTHVRGLRTMGEKEKAKAKPSGARARTSRAPGA